jgi:hypothetical protein
VPRVENLLRMHIAVLCFAVLWVVVGRAAQVPRGSVLCRGRLDIPQTSAADLDDGRLAEAQKNADIWFEAVNPSMMRLTPLNGATLSKLDRKSVGLAACIAATLTPTPIMIQEVAEGDVLCVKTKEQRYSLLKIDLIYSKYPLLDPHVRTLGITYTTWER